MNGNICSQVPCTVVYESVLFVGPNENGLFRQMLDTLISFVEVHLSMLYPTLIINPLNAELNPISHLLAL
jgi:hypothetical protein